MAENKRLSYNEIPNMEEDWGLDTRNGMPYAGKSVQSFLKNVINEKSGPSWFDPSTNSIHFFRNDEDKMSYIETGDASLIQSTTVLNFSGTMRQVKVLNQMGTTALYYTTVSTSAPITCGFVSQQKGITDTAWEEVNEDFYVTVSVDKGSVGNYVNVETDKLVLNGQTLTVDVRKYLGSGNNRVRFSVRGATTGESGQLVFTAMLTSMYLSASNTNWWTPFVEGVAYKFGGFNIGGNLNKVVKVHVTNEALGYDQTFEDNIGMATYLTNAYQFSGLTFPETGTGTYRVEIWVEADALETEHLVYHIMMIASADVGTAEAVCINAVNADVKNGMDSMLYQYAVYNGGYAEANVGVTLSVGGENVLSQELTGVATNAALTYSAALEIENENMEFELSATMTVGAAAATATLVVDNSLSFPAVAGAAFYMNPATRSNAQANRASIVNEADGSEIAATVSGIGWVDGTDGWTNDEDGRPCLLIPAGGKIEMDFAPMSSMGDGWAFEASYKIKNAADYDEVAMMIADSATAAGFRGVRVKPKNVCVHSRDLASNDLAQSYNTEDEELVHVVVSIAKNYNTNYGNLVQIFINGGAKVQFSFTSTDSFVHAGKLTLGSTSADTYIYKMRVYNQGFGWPDAVSNWINCLPTYETKMTAWTRINEILDDSYNIDYDKVVAAGKNTMVVEMLNGAPFPDKLHPAGGQSNLTIDIKNIPDGEIDEEMRQLLTGYLILDQEAEGQGTTSMTYLKWNIRWKLAVLIAKKRRITAKKNVASSMHSHKMGATRLFNMMFQDVCGGNEVGGRVAVAQYPVFGFWKQLVDGTDDQYIYTFVGLYSVGADKGDNPTFGFDNTTYENSLMHLEGTDHTPMMVGFDYPWDQCRYSASKEAIGAITANGDIAAAWEVGAAGQLEPDSSTDEAAVQAFLDAEFKPAYEVVYNNRTTILGVSETLDEINADATAWRKLTTADGKPYSELEFFTDGEYDLLYYNVAESTFKKNGMNLLTQFGLTADDVSGMDLASKTEFFKTKRREAFLANWTNYWHKDDSLFHEVFIEIIAATDNFKKNNYPYKFGLLADGGRWRRRQDDLDSIADINNQGFPAKSYSVMLWDKTSTGSGSVFRGENSNFTVLVDECCKEDKKAMARRIFDAMAARSPYGQSQIEKLVGCIRMCFWDYAQDYFSESAYNSDTVWTYIDAWPLWTSKIYENDVDPLQQALGSHAEAERAWFTLRLIFYASMVNWGPFATDNGDDTSLGQVSFRAAGGKTFSITPAIDLNPTILIGQSDMAAAGRRVMAGETVEVTVPDMGNNDTHVYIQATDYIEDLGDLCDLQVSADNPVLSVGSKRMRRLKVGDVDASRVTSNVQRMVVGSCPSMEEVDARNLVSLTGTVDLTQLPRLREAMFAGTSAANVVIASGSKVTSLSLPSTVTTLSLIKLQNLTADGLTFGELSSLSYLRVESNAHLNSLELLRVGMAGGALAAVRVLGISGEGTSEDLNLLAALADAGANGITATGEVDSSSGPIVEGELTIMVTVNQDLLDKIAAAFPNLTVHAQGIKAIEFEDAEVERICVENWGENGIITREQAAAVKSIGTIFRENTIMQSFNELQYFTGLTQLDVYAFLGNTSLKSVVLPTSVTEIHDSAFRGCSAFESINLDNVVTLGSTDAEGWTGVFHGCSSLTEIGNTDKVESIRARTFYKCSALSGELSFPSVTFIAGGAFLGCPNITKVYTPKWTGAANSTFYNCTKLEYVDTSLITSLGSAGSHNTGVFYGCTNLTSVDLSSLTSIGTGSGASSNFMNSGITELNLASIVTIGASGVRGATNLTKCILGEDVTTIGDSAFNDCPKMSVMVCRAVTPPSLGGSLGITPTIYVPDASLEAYKAATNWSTYASRILPISELSPHFAIEPSSCDVYEKIQLTCNYDGVVKEATWSIVSGSEFGSITQDGLLTFNEGVTDGSTIVVRAVAKENSEWVDEQTYTKTNILIEHGVALQNNGSTTTNASMSTVGFVPTKGATSIKWGVTGGTNGILCEYTQEGVCQDYWGASGNPRTVTIKATSTLVKASFSTEHLDYAYIMNASTNEYLWKGIKV